MSQDDRIEQLLKDIKRVLQQMFWGLIGIAAAVGFMLK